MDEEFSSISAREDYERQPQPIPFGADARTELPPISTSRPAEEPEGWRLHRLIWIFVILAVAYLSKPLIERVSYAYHSGREKAQFDAAIEGLEELDKLSLSGLSAASRLVARAVGPSVVHIQTEQSAGGPGRNIKVGEGQGSGVIVDSSGYVLTNYHVIQNASKVQVNLSDGRTVDATYVGSDSGMDIAVLKIEAEDLVAARWGDSDALNVGDLVWAVGSPFGLDHTVTFGIVSAKERPGVGQYQDFLQTDAAVNPGNSGGPLVNVKGEIVGINTAIVGERYSGVSFALPSKMAQDTYRQIIDNGKVIRGWLGVDPRRVTKSIAERLGVDQERVAFVRLVVPGSPADRGGMVAGDIINHWNNEPLADLRSLYRRIAETDVGSRVVVKVLREGEEVALTVTVDQRPAEISE